MADVASYFVPFDLDSGGGTESVIGVSPRGASSGGSLPVFLDPVALVDNTVNPTVGGIATFGMVFDGATWDRMLGDATDGVLVNLGTNNDVTVLSGTIDVQGTTAADAPLTVDPVTIGGRGSTAAPTPESLDGDVVNLWLDLRGAQKTVMVDDAGVTAMDGTNNALRVNIVAGAAGGVTHTDDAAFTATTDDGVPVFGFHDDTAPPGVTDGNAGAVRMTGTRSLHMVIRDGAEAERAANVTAANELEVSTELPAAAALSDANANPTTPMVGCNLLGWDRVNSDWTRIAGIVDGEVVGALNAGLLMIGSDGTNYQALTTDAAGHLQVDILTGGGSDTPANPVNDTQTSAAVAVATPTDIDSTAADDKKLAWIDVWSSVAWKGELFTVDNGVEGTRDGVMGGPAHTAVQYRPTHRNYIQLGNTAGVDAFRLKVTNLDDNLAADFHVVFHYED